MIRRFMALILAGMLIVLTGSLGCIADEAQADDAALEELFVELPVDDDAESVETETIEEELVPEAEETETLAAEADEAEADEAADEAADETAGEAEPIVLECGARATIECDEEISLVSRDEGIVHAEGNVLFGVAPGSCEIELSKANEIVEVLLVRVIEAQPVERTVERQPVEREAEQQPAEASDGNVKPQEEEAESFLAMILNAESNDGEADDESAEEVSEEVSEEDAEDVPAEEVSSEEEEDLPAQDTLVGDADAASYAIVYNLNGGVNSAKNPARYSSQESFEFDAPSKTGYSFAGWFKDSEFKKPFNGITAGMSGKKTVYAKWKANKYRVVFYGNGATSGTMAAQDMTYAKYADLCANGYKRTGYKFAGWNTLQGGDGTAYGNKARVRNLTSANGDEFALYAQWKLNTYKISYALDQGTNSADNIKSYTVLDGFTPSDPVRDNYTFTGWFTNSKKTKPFTGFEPGCTGDLKLYAGWRINSYTVNYNGNGASNVNPYTQSIACRKKTTLKTNKYACPGYKFTGWNTESDGSGTAYADRASVKDLCAEDGAEITLYAQWKLNVYKISYKLDGGVNSAANPGSYTVLDAFTFEAPTRKGYVFNGWYLDSKKTKPTEGIEVGSLGNITVYAKWRAKKFSFVFMGNGANNDTPYVQECVYGKTTALKSNSFKKKAHTFIGWNTEADGSGTAYANKKKLTGYDPEDGTQITLYAQWRPNLKKMDFRGTEFDVVNTGIDFVDFAEKTAGKVCQTAGNYHGYCLKFSYYYGGCIYNGITDPKLKSAARGAKNGCGWGTLKTGSLRKCMRQLYDGLNKGKPQILMVKATNHVTRHFLVVIGYKSSVVSGDTIVPKDLLIMDVHDGQLESMDPEIWQDNTRLIHKQNGSYHLEYMR